MPPVHATSFAEKRRILQLETLYDLALALHAERGERELVDELLQRVCTVLDPAAAVAVTQEADGSGTAALVGWIDEPPSAERLLAEPLWRDLLAEGGALERHVGSFAGRRFTDLLATPLAYRGTFLGYLALLDKEERGAAGSAFSAEDRRFLESVASLAGVALDGARRLELLSGERERLAEETKALRGRLGDEVSGQRIVAHAPPMRRVIELVERVAPRGVNVLVRGESGTGKELIAKLLHVGSRRSGPLVALNCGALPESLLESELFGIEGGVATGVQARRGKLELASGGTLFLDEIGDMAPALQVKLLRAIQEREVVRVGSEKTVAVDVRVVAATHRDLEAMILAGTFREDLYYRLRGVEIVLPPLRERREDIPHLVRHFTESFCAREGIPSPAWQPEALAFLLGHDFPGNVRELQNLVEGAITLSDRRIDREIVRSLLGAGGTPAEATDTLDLSALEQRHIARVVRLAGGNKSAAAKLLGLSRRTLLRKGF
jgi:transcriptional regulator with GAF, ATPase, and Fis domain